MKLPKLTLRDLFAVLTIAAVLVAWWADHSRLQRRLQAQNYQIKILSITNTKADELAAVLRDTYHGDADNAIDIATDTRTNSIIVRGPEQKLDEVTAMALRLDQEGN